MSASVSLKAGVLGFEVNIVEFCQVVRDFVGARLDGEARRALKTMITEVDKDFELVVEVMTPLYAINTDADMRKRWPEVFQKFKSEYFKQWGSLATSCGIVSQELERMKKAHDWKRRVPLLRKAVEELDSLGQRWMANDAALYTAMNGFMESANRALTDVNSHCGRPKNALRKLRGVLRGTETGLLSIKGYLNELKQFSARL